MFELKESEKVNNYLKRSKSSDNLSSECLFNKFSKIIR